jgi:DNA polymerase-3 subunit epsilon
MRSTIPDFLPLSRPLIIFDLETTGLSVGEDRILELAYEKILPDGRIVSAVHRFNPGRPIPEEASRINKIYDADVQDEPKFAAHAYTLWNMFDGADVGGFNIIGFDLPFLRGEFSSVGKSFDFSQKKILDAKILYHAKAPRDMFAPRNLSAAYKRYCGKDHSSAHTGAGDVRATVEVLEKLLEEYPEFRDWEALLELNENKKLLESAKTEHAPLPPSEPSPQTLF